MRHRYPDPAGDERQGITRHFLAGNAADNLVTQRYGFVLLLVLALSACSLPSLDGELESSISEAIEADAVIAITAFGNVVVTASGSRLFEGEPEVREGLAQQVAELAFAAHSEADAIMVGFATVEPEFQQVIYAWLAIDGELQRVDSRDE